MTPEPLRCRPARALTPGARVALVAPAGPLDADRVERARDRCRSLDLEPVVFPAAHERQAYLAGPDARRLADLQAALDDDAVDAVWSLRGGYGTLRILDRLDLARQHRDPIPFLGFSDNTTLHVRHAREGVISFHGPNAVGALTDQARDWLRTVLYRAEAPGPLPTVPGEPVPEGLGGGAVEAPLMGGNLAMLAALCGSGDTPRAGGAILFLEDVGEPAYRVDRMLVQLERAGVLDGVRGLAVGRFTDVSAEDASLIRELVEGLARRLDVPAVVDLPFGHVKANLVLPVGGMARLDGDAGTLTLTAAAVAVP